MKSQVRRKKIDKLILEWDHKALSLSNDRKDTSHDYDKQRSLDEYFDFLDEVKPHKHELMYTNVIDKPFTLV